MTQQTPHDEQAPPALQPLAPAPPQSGIAPGTRRRPAGSRSPPTARSPGRPRRPGRRTWQWVVAAGVTVLLAWLTYSRGGWIPVLSAFDLGVHEFGHLLTAWAPALLCSLAGSFLQVAAAAAARRVLLVAA